MHDFISLNAKILSCSDSKIPASSSAVLNGKGVFTTLAIINSNPFLWEKHWCRLIDNAGRLGIDMSAISEEFVADALFALLDRNKVARGKCRISLLDESPSKLWNQDGRHGTSLLIQSADLRDDNKSFSVGISTCRINSSSPLAGIKSSNYLEQILALEESKAQGFDEAIRQNEKDLVVSFCMGNIFWLEKDNQRLITPSLKTGCLAGTTRELITERFDVVEVEKRMDDFLQDAESVFITSSGGGVKRINRINGRKLKLTDHDLMELFQKEIDNQR